MNILLNGFLTKKNFFIFCAFGVLLISNADLEALLSCDTTASTALLIDAKTGKVLFSKNSEAPMHPASTTKIATAIYLLERRGANLQEITTASQDSIGAVTIAARRFSGKHPSYRLEFGGTHMWLKAGEQVDLKTLLYGLMLSSANDAANVIAETAGGTVPQFMSELNVFLQKIGCKNTQFQNPHGLPDDRHITTAQDLATMSRYAMKNPIFREVVSSTKYLRPQTNKQPEIVLTQFNALLKPGGKHYYPYATGIKTGYTIQAGHTLVASADNGDRSLIAVVCHKEGSDKRYRSAIQLFETAFKEPKISRTLFSKAHDLFHQKIEGAKDVLHAGFVEDVVISSYPSEQKNFRFQIQWDFPQLPIDIHQVVGRVFIFDDQDSLEKTVPLLAIKPVEPTFSYKMEKAIFDLKNELKKYRVLFGYACGFALLSLALIQIHRKQKKRERPLEDS